MSRLPLLDELGALLIGASQAERCGTPRARGVVERALSGGTSCATAKASPCSSTRPSTAAILELFGSPSQRLYGAYDEVHPLAEGREDRVGLHELVALLVHAVLFGGSYGSRAAAIAQSLAR